MVKSSDQQSRVKDSQVMAGCINAAMVAAPVCGDNEGKQRGIAGWKTGDLLFFGLCKYKHFDVFASQFELVSYLSLLALSTAGASLFCLGSCDLCSNWALCIHCTAATMVTRLSLILQIMCCHGS